MSIFGVFPDILWWKYREIFFRFLISSLPKMFAIFQGNDWIIVSLKPGRVFSVFLSYVDCWFTNLRNKFQKHFLLHFEIFGFPSPYGLSTYRCIFSKVQQNKFNRIQWNLIGVDVACEWFDWLEGSCSNKLACILLHPNLKQCNKSKIT